MILLEVDAIRKHFGPNPVLDGVTFEVRPGDRVGLVGPNGCGKTTLLRILAGWEDADGGSFRLHDSVRLGYLEQQPKFDPSQTLHDAAKKALADLIALEPEAIAVAEEMAHATDPAEHRRLASRFDHLQHELHRLDAYNLDHKIERVLEGLRFRAESFNQPIASLSGGEQNRLMLAKLLLAEPNLMILDEPSNHLDIEATEWLEDFLLESSSAMILVSHDRYFLDKVTNRTLELYHGTVDLYPGNFSAYWGQKGERLLVQSRTYEKQQIELEKTRDFIRRNHYGQKHAQAEDRRKKLEKMEQELVAPPRMIAVPPMKFLAASRSGDIVVRAEGLAKSYDRQLFRDVTLNVGRGQRWGLLGPNGCGKTTLLKCFLGQVDLDAGRVGLGQGLELGYFDQQLAGLADDTQVVDAIRPKKKQFNEQQRRDLLARFGITGDTALQKVASLSGGERCRAALARLAAEEANFLVLDEPTNHLDLWARDSLEKALANFDGTVLFVSHDRYFVNQVADHLLIVEPDRVRVIEGNYETFQMLSGRKTATIEEVKSPPPLKNASGDAVKKSSTPIVQPVGGGKKPNKPIENRFQKDQGKGRRQRPKDGRGKGRGAAQDSGMDQEKDQAMKEGKNWDAFLDLAGKPLEKKPARKRRFPFRKAADIEKEIQDRESAVEYFQQQLLLPENLRHGERVRTLKMQIAEEQETLKTLYEHWEEALELNW
jgi:ATP-binding cassette, subfamily F, member 3